MKLKEFIIQYDKENAIVLLEGKRKVLEEDKEKLSELGKLLAENTKHILFRSGNADGSDLFFAKGVAGVDKKRMQVITPYTGHLKKNNCAGETIPVDKLDIVCDSEIAELSKLNVKTKYLIDKYLNGGRDQYSMKAAYIIRDTVKVTGFKEIKEAAFGIFYDDLSNPKAGGTGHTMRICEQKDVPLINQRVWFKWLSN